MTICLNETMELNGAKQFVAIRAQRPGLPLLLYLHGGPGDAALPLVLKYNAELARHFTLVIWEQRGAGKSYYPFAPDESLTISTFVEDARELSQRLLERYGQEKLYLVGHSWGSVLGLTLCQKHPELIRAYLGCGQVVDMKESSRRAYDFAAARASGKAARRLAEIDCSYTGPHWLEDLLFVTRQVVKHGGSLYGAKNYNRFVLDFLRSREYGIKDLLAREKGGLQSIRALWRELMGVSFTSVTAYDLPVVFAEGEHDAHVSSALARDYYESITTPKAFHLFPNSCHFPQWSDPRRFHQVCQSLLAL